MKNLTQYFNENLAQENLVNESSWGSNGHNIAGLSNIWFKLDTNEWVIK